MAAPVEADTLLVDTELVVVVVALTELVLFVALFAAGVLVALVALVALVELLLLWSVVPQALSATAVIRMKLRKSERPKVTTLVVCICQYSPLR